MSSGHSDTGQLQQSVFVVLTYVPNIIDYGRLILLIVASLYFYSSPVTFLFLYVASASLDAVDGIVARSLNQISAFGAWLDVVVDNIGRSLLWCPVSQCGFFVVSLEWLTFVCNHTHGQQWKSRIVGPAFVNKVMQNNFRTPLGILAVGSLNVLPVWLYCLHHDIPSLLWIPCGVFLCISDFFANLNSINIPTDCVWVMWHFYAQVPDVMSALCSTYGLIAGLQVCMLAQNETNFRYFANLVLRFVEAFG